MLVALVPSPAAAAAPERFEVLQAVFHPVSAAGWTRQGFDERCVLVEQHALGADAPTAEARAATEALLNNTTRRQLAYAEFGANDTRFEFYYRSTSVPTAIFDGTARVSGGGPQALPHAEVAYEEAARKAPLASINVSSATVISTGHLDYEVFVPSNMSSYTVSVRAVIVEDLAPSAAAGRDLRFLVRHYLPGDRVGLVGNASVSGRLNFTLESSWVQGRLAAIVFVQVDTPPPGPFPPQMPRVDALGQLVVPLAVIATGSVFALMVARSIRGARKAKLR